MFTCGGLTSRGPVAKRFCGKVMGVTYVTIRRRDSKADTAEAQQLSKDPPVAALEGDTGFPIRCPLWRCFEPQHFSDCRCLPLTRSGTGLSVVSETGQEAGGHNIIMLCTI
jgi:hypothetical protein